MLLLSALLTIAAPSAPSLSGAERARLARAAAAAQAEDCTTVLAQLDPLLTPARAPALGAAASAITSLAAFCEVRLKHADRAYALSLRATEANDASAETWRLRLGLELEREDLPSAVATVEALASGRGAILNTVPIRWLWSIASGTRSAGQEALRLRLLRVAALSYSPDPIDGNSDGLRLQYALMLLKSGEANEARRVLAGVTVPGVLRTIRIDPVLRPILPPDIDLKAATEQRLVVDQGLVESYPNRLSPLLDAATDLRQLGRPQEALTLLESVRTRVADARFADSDEFRVWWWDGLSRTQSMLGQADASIASFRTGMGLPESGGRNVSQVINLMQTLVGLGRAEEALTVPTSGLGEVSPFGEMQLRMARGCAHALLGHAAAAAAERAYMEAHRRNAPAALGDLLLCIGDQDAAAADLIARLGDAETRADALEAFSTYAPPPVAVPPTVTERARRQLAARADVKAALARAGGTAVFNVQPPDR